MQDLPEGCSGASRQLSSPHLWGGPAVAASASSRPHNTGCPFQFGSCQVLFERFSSVPLATLSDADRKVCRRNIEPYMQALPYAVSSVPLAQSGHGYSHSSNAGGILSS